jgi:hypothetical protein
VFGGFAASVAQSKRRDPIGWFILGFLFSIIAVIAIAGMPSLPERATESETLAERFALHRGTTFAGCSKCFSAYATNGMNSPKLFCTKGQRLAAPLTQNFHDVGGTNEINGGELVTRNTASNAT